MVNSYPVAYRTPQAANSGGQGFQMPSSVEKYFRPATPKTQPANDNFRAPPPAANDNLSQWRYKPGKVPFGFTRKALRYLPYAGLAFAAYEFVEIYRAMKGTEPSKNYQFPGYYLAADCGRRPDLIGASSWAYACAATLLENHTGPGAPATSFPNSATIGYIIWNERQVNSNTWAYQKALGYAPLPGATRVPNNFNGYPVPGKPPVYVPVVAPTPNYYPAANPEMLPIGQPAPTPAPIPFPAIPHRNPTGYPQSPAWGNDDPVIVIENPGAAPTKEITVDGVKTTRPRHEYRPPRKNEKERKVNATVKGNLGVGVERIISGLTESNDAINAIYDALPDEYKVQMWVVNKAPYDKYWFVGWKDHKFYSRYGNANRYHKEVRNKVKPQEKLRQIYKNFEHLDIAKALQNLVINEIQDQAIGRLSRGASGINKHLNRGFGIQIGPAL